MKAKICLAVFLFFYTVISIPITSAYSADISFTVDIGKYINIVMSYNSVYFGTVTSGTNDNAAPNYLLGAYNSSISTNANYALTTNATDWDGGVGIFGAGNMTLDWNTTAGNLNVTNSIPMSTSPVLIHNNTAFTVTREYHGFWLDVPAGQTAGSYSSSVTFTYANI